MQPRARFKAISTMVGELKYLVFCGVSSVQLPFEALAIERRVASTDSTPRAADAGTHTKGAQGMRRSMRRCGVPEVSPGAHIRKNVATSCAYLGPCRPSCTASGAVVGVLPLRVKGTTADLSSCRPGAKGLTSLHTLDMYVLINCVLYPVYMAQSCFCGA